MDQNVYTPEDKYYDYPDRPVPHDKRKSPINIAVVTTGMAVAMSTLYTGSALAEVMNFKEGTIAIVVGSVILAILASLTGGIGANQGISTSMLSRVPFGRKGSNICNTAIQKWQATQSIRPQIKCYSRCRAANVPCSHTPRYPREPSR